jgi:hypothetical protein
LQSIVQQGFIGSPTGSTAPRKTAISLIFPNRSPNQNSEYPSDRPLICTNSVVEMSVSRERQFVQSRHLVAHVLQFCSHLFDGIRSGDITQGRFSLFSQHDQSSGEKRWIANLSMIPRLDRSLDSQGEIGIVRDLLIHFTGKINATIALRGQLGGSLSQTVS